MSSMSHFVQDYLQRTPYLSLLPLNHFYENDQTPRQQEVENTSNAGNPLFTNFFLALIRSSIIKNNKELSTLYKF